VKHIIYLVLGFSLTIFNHAKCNADTLTYAHGIKIGYLGKYLVKPVQTNSKVPDLIYVGEGELYLGNSSQKTIGENPWYFSSDDGLRDYITKFIGKYVVIQYDENEISLGRTATSHFIRKIYEFKPETAVAECNNKFPGYNNRAAQTSSISGNIVDLTVRGHLHKTYEMKFQNGGVGSDFWNLSFSHDVEFRRCLNNWLISGQIATLKFAVYPDTLENLKLGRRESGYEVLSVTPIKLALKVQPQK
jgi:hypothetical protein